MHLLPGGRGAGSAVFDGCLQRHQPFGLGRLRHIGQSGEPIDVCRAGGNRGGFGRRFGRFGQIVHVVGREPDGGERVKVDTVLTITMQSPDFATQSAQRI